MDKQNSLTFTSAVSTGRSYPPPKQSANSLFHFIKKLEYLLTAIEKDALVPRYCVELVEYLDIGLTSIAYPMLCFCDINLHKLDEHIDFYGGYGIAFSKEWGIHQGIQPIQYLNQSSHLHNDFSEAFKMAISSPGNDEAQNFLLSQMYFLKPIEGEMLRDEEIISKNFTDECEWRSIPSVEPEGLPQVLIDSEIVRKDILNNALTYASNTWLRFLAEDIKYLILQNRDDFDKVTSLILRKDGLSSDSRHRLISKIIIWDESRGDF